MNSKILFQPIGYYKPLHQAQEPYQVPRQPDDSDREGIIELRPSQHYEMALQDLEGFERIWIIYQFHQNKNWKPLILPPRGTDSKKGVFATRAPYRPNPIGLSCVRLLQISDLKIKIAGADFLDQTPILDIKPYIPEVDSFPESKVGWLTNVEDGRFQLEWMPELSEIRPWLQKNNLQELIDFTNRQLEFEPTDSRRKRVSRADEIAQNEWVLAYRTWRIHWRHLPEQKIQIHKISSGYSSIEMQDPADTYGDKAQHRAFLQKFGS